MLDFEVDARGHFWSEVWGLELFCVVYRAHLLVEMRHPKPWTPNLLIRYSGVAYCIFFSIVAHSAFNMYFSFYAVGGLGMLGNTALISLTMLKTVAVEVTP